MYEEDNNNVMNFTTQNSFLHYGVKGMKWGVITSEYEPVGRLRSRYSQWQNGRKNTIGRQLTSKVAGKDYNSMTTVNSRQTDRPLQRQKNVTGKDDGYTMARKDEQIRNEDDLKKAISNSNEKSKSNNNVETINEFDNLDVYADSKNANPRLQEYITSWQQKSEKLKNDMSRYIKAYESIADMDPKYQKRFLEKYGKQINSAFSDYKAAQGTFYDGILKSGIFNPGNPYGQDTKLSMDIKKKINEDYKDPYNTMDYNMDGHDFAKMQQQMIVEDGDIMARLRKHISANK